MKTMKYYHKVSGAGKNSDSSLYSETKKLKIFEEQKLQK